MYDILKTVHVFSVILWIGGMMFVQWFLRPSLLHLPSEQRPVLMHEVLRRFFRAVLVTSLATLVSGFWMLGRVAREMRVAGLDIEISMSTWIMALLGSLMVLIFLYIRFGLFRQLSQAIQFNRSEQASPALARIRFWVSINLALGLIVVAAVFLV